MRVAKEGQESWKRMVLQSMPAPAWLDPDAPQGDVVISSRVRYARNIEGFKFPHHARPDELQTVAQLVRRAVKTADLQLEILNHPSPAEREYLLSCRLMSPEFAEHSTGRILLLDTSRSISIMVNEEDHLRIQALSAGWSISTALLQAQLVLDRLDSQLDFARAEPWAYLTASPSNVGEGVRLSAMFHLIALAHSKKLSSVLKALAGRNLVARGLFGESSRAIGAFFQVSVTHQKISDLSGAAEYLMREERKARSAVSRKELAERTASAVRYAISQSEISLADTLRVLAWVRWASVAGIDGMPKSYRTVDEWLSTMDVKSSDRIANRRRADSLRARLDH